MRIQSRVALVCTVSALLGIPFAHGQDKRPLPGSPTGICGSLDNAFGPYDYRTARREDVRMAERFHFTPKVEALREGQSGQIGGDLDYVLRAFPNHPRVLYAMVRYGEQLRSSHVPGANYPVECYFDRAVRFVPDDPQVRALYANYLIRNRRFEEARRQLVAAEETSPSDPQVLYNLGLSYMDLNDHDRALAYAHKAYAAGITFPGLRDRLKKAKQWREPGR